MNELTPIKEFKQQTWQLNELYPQIKSAEIEAELAQVEAIVSDLNSYQPLLNPDIKPEDFLKALHNVNDLSYQLSRLNGYAYLVFAQDTQDQEAQNFLSKVRQVIAESQNRTLFFELWWKELDEQNVARLLAVSGDYRYWLETLRRESPYTLSELEERIVNLKNVNGRDALVQLYTSITNRYSFELEVAGETKSMTRGELTTYFFSTEASLRAAAHKELYRVYEKDVPVLGQLYQTLVRDWRSEHLDLRHYTTPIAVRNLANDIPDEVVTTLLDVVKANTSLFQDYFRLKARWLGLEKLSRFDLYAPVTAKEMTFPYQEAVGTVLQSFQEFDPKIAQLALRVFEENHIDSEVRPGKDSGAFCATITPDLTPWLLQSYHGKPNDVATLAHELGHAVHSLLANHHSTLTYMATLPLAETASTFGEMLLVDHLLAQYPDPEVQQILLFNQMDDAYMTIMRQSYFSIFEQDAHDAIHQGASIDELCRLYLENVKDQFGDAVKITDVSRFEWLAIPHIFEVPFYVYAYAFGQLLVLALYEQYKKEGDMFKPRYLEILAAGGSEAPIKILEKAGIDVYRAEFWQGGFNVLAQLLERLKAIPMPSSR